MTIKNEQSKDTDNIGHKTQNRDKQKDNQEWTIQRHRQHWSQDTDNNGHKTQTTLVTRHRQHWSNHSVSCDQCCLCLWIVHF
jgi:hypothetical protein